MTGATSWLLAANGDVVHVNNIDRCKLFRRAAEHAIEAIAPFVYIVSLYFDISKNNNRIMVKRERERERACVCMCFTMNRICVLMTISKCNSSLASLLAFICLANSYSKISN